MILKDFTPVMDNMVKKDGPTRALVFGSVWRFCQMSSRNECTAAISKIADRIGVSHRTALRHIKKLCQDNYLKDLTPKLRNKPHTYRDTGKVQMEIGMTESHSHYDRESQHGMTESHSHYDRKSDEESSKKAIKKPSKKKDRATNIANTPQPAPKSISQKDQQLPLIKENAVKKKKVSPGAVKPIKKPVPPAIQVYREMTHKFPTKAIWPAIVEAVGTEPDDLKFWGEVVHNYVLCGWYYANVKTMLKFYQRREIPAVQKPNKGNKNGSRQKPTKSTLDQKPTFNPKTGEIRYPDGRREKASVPDV